MVSPCTLIELLSWELAGQMCSIASYLHVKLGLQVKEIGTGQNKGTVHWKLRSRPTDLLVATQDTLHRAL